MRKTRHHWTTLPPLVNQGALIYHLAGADKFCRQKEQLTPFTLMHYIYRFAFEEKLLGRLIHQFAPKRNRALDVGCGTGRNSLVLSRYFNRVDAFDISKNFIEENKERFSAITSIHFFRLDVDDIQQLTEQYDFVFLGGLCMYLSDHEAKNLLINLKTLLSPSAVLAARDTLSTGNTEVVEDVKTYRGEHEHEQLFIDGGYRLLAQYNGPTRNMWVTVFRRLPHFFQNNRLFFAVFSRLIPITLTFALHRAMLQPFQRHPRANQLFYLYAPQLS